MRVHKKGEFFGTIKKARNKDSGGKLLSNVMVQDSIAMLRAVKVCTKTGIMSSQGATKLVLRMDM